MSAHIDESIVPDDLVCPITQEIFSDPVMDRTGRTFERQAILMWLSENGTCPMTREPRRAFNYIPNPMMVTKVRIWMKANNFDYNEQIKKRTQDNVVLTLKNISVVDGDTSDESSSDTSGEEPVETRSEPRRRRFRIFGKRR